MKSGSNIRSDVTKCIDHVRGALGFGVFLDKFILRNGDPPPPVASADGIKSASLGHWWFSESDMYGIKIESFNPNKKVRGSRKQIDIEAKSAMTLTILCLVSPALVQLLYQSFLVSLILWVFGSPSDPYRR